MDADGTIDRLANAGSGRRSRTAPTTRPCSGRTRHDLPRRHHAPGAGRQRVGVPRAVPRGDHRPAAHAARPRSPGLIGLLIGGFLIGPHGFGLLDAGSTTIPDLGQLGLLYLDVRRRRGARPRPAQALPQRAAITFGLLDVRVPDAVRHDRGLRARLGGGGRAAARLAARVAHAVLYPLVRNAGLANDPVDRERGGRDRADRHDRAGDPRGLAGTQSEMGAEARSRCSSCSGWRCCCAFCFARAAAAGALDVPPARRPAHRALRHRGRGVPGRGVVAEMFGIEGIVGAFFAGLAMNRLVPNEGPLMDRIDFFGAAVFVPVFLVSVGAAARPVRDVPGRDARARRAVHRGVHGRQVHRGAAHAAAAGRDAREAGVVFGSRRRRPPRRWPRRPSASRSGCSASPSSTRSSCSSSSASSSRPWSPSARRSASSCRRPSERELGEHVLVVVRAGRRAARAAPRAGHRRAGDRRGRRDPPAGRGRVRRRPPRRPRPPRRDEQRASASTSTPPSGSPTTRRGPSSSPPTTSAPRSSSRSWTRPRRAGRRPCRSPRRRRSRSCAARIDQPLEAVRVVSPGGEGSAATVAAKLAAAVPAAAQRVTAFEDAVVAGDVWFSAVIGLGAAGVDGPARRRRARARARRARAGDARGDLPARDRRLSRRPQRARARARPAARRPPGPSGSGAFRRDTARPALRWRRASRRSAPAASPSRRRRGRRWRLAPAARDPHVDEHDAARRPAAACAARSCRRR